MELADLYRGELSFRRLSVLIRHLPPESAVARLGAPKEAALWGVSEYLLADLFHAFAGKPHPARPSGSKGGSTYAAKRAALEAQRARLQRG